MADKEIADYTNKTILKMVDSLTSDPHQPLPCMSNATDAANGDSSVASNPPSLSSSTYQLLPRASAAVSQSDKGLGIFLDQLTEIKYELLSLRMMDDVPPMKKRFDAIPSSEELVTLSQFEVLRNTARSTQWVVKVFSSWAEENTKNEV